MSTIIELLDRVRLSTGPDRKLDTAIHWHLICEPDAMNYRIDPFWGWQNKYENGWTAWHGQSPYKYTASIDAAAALFEHKLPHWEWLVRKNETVGYFASAYHRSNGKIKIFREQARTAPLAILAALLTALGSDPAAQHEETEP